MDSAAKYLCSLDRDLPLLSDAIKDTAKTDKVILVVGPEGDVAPEEVSLLVERYKFIKVSLGAGVLRSELAVVAGVVLAREHAAKPFNFRLIGESSRSE
jgi:16S rRNA U1498 N3-methylase RsmE